MAKPIIAIDRATQRGQIHALQQTHRPAHRHRRGHPRRDPGPDLRRAATGAGATFMPGGHRRHRAGHGLRDAAVHAPSGGDRHRDWRTPSSWWRTCTPASPPRTRTWRTMLRRSPASPCALAVNKCDCVGPANPGRVRILLPGPRGPASRPRRSTATAPATCWTGFWTDHFPEDAGEEEDEDDRHGRHRRQAERGRVQPAELQSSAWSGSSSPTWRAPPGTPSTACFENEYREVLLQSTRRSKYGNMPQVFPSSASIAGIWLWDTVLSGIFRRWGRPVDRSDITETFFTPAKCVPAD